jgi:hypothetical protein
MLIVDEPEQRVAGRDGLSREGARDARAGLVGNDPVAYRELLKLAEHYDSIALQVELRAGNDPTSPVPK